MTRFAIISAAVLTVLSLGRVPASAETLCDPSFENCRVPLINLIDAETKQIDVAFWFMEDARYTTALINAWNRGVKIRVLVDPRANVPNPLNADRLSELKSAGIPMRYRTASGILHWKVMLFAGQNTVEFSKANYSAEAFVPTTPYLNYIDEVIYFSDDQQIVDTFKTKYDDLWTNTTNYANYANVTGSLTRSYTTSYYSPDMNFPPEQSFVSRSVKAYNAETQRIDAIMYRITDRRHTDAIINAVGRGIPVRLITEPQQYRDPNRLWHSWNVDRLYMAGVQIRHRAHAGLTHEGSVILYGQAMVIFGSSNWSSPSTDSQQEHNYFTKKNLFFNYFINNFDRKWNNSTGNQETTAFVPLPPDKPAYQSPANGATGLSTSVTLKWYGGPWAHLYDVYLGTTSTSLQVVASDLALGPSESSTQYQSYTLSNLSPATTYFYKVVGKTMALKTASGPVYSFTTGGTATPPPTNGTLGSGDILLYADRATNIHGNWTVIADSTAADAKRIANTDKAAAKISTPLASPADYFDLTFTPQTGVGYHLWIRGKAENNYWANDSAYVQFSNSVDKSGTAVYRIGTTSAATYNLEDCSGCGVQAWGWQDNGYGVNTFGPLIYFNSTSAQKLRVQIREDGLSIDQIMLSPQKFLSTSPGALKNDGTIYPLNQGGGTTSPPPSSGEVVMYASHAKAVGNWFVTSDSTAAGGSRLHNPDAGAAKISTALASPVDYFELTFTAQAGVPYHLWIRGKADANSWANDSVHVQFNDSVDQNANAVYRIGTTGSTVMNLEDCSGCGESGWGWQDNGYGANVMGPHIYFGTSGTHTVRIQVREDGLSIDEVMLSPSSFLSSSPGLLKNDTNTYAQSNSGQ
jgi:HKD family nuclease